MSTDMRMLAKQYHACGFNIIPLGADKRPVKTGIADNGKIWRWKWEDWQSTRQNGDDLKAILRPKWWADVRGIAAVNGFNGACCIDLDSRRKDEPAAPTIPHATALRWLEELGLPTDYRWLVKTPGGGWHIWMRTDDIGTLTGKLDRLYPDDETVGHIELRWTGHYTALPGTLHPSGGVYEFAN